LEKLESKESDQASLIRDLELHLRPPGPPSSKTNHRDQTRSCLWTEDKNRTHYSRKIGSATPAKPKNFYSAENTTRG
jgi:hypothetical protein